MGEVGLAARHASKIEPRSILVPGYTVVRKWFGWNDWITCMCKCILQRLHMQHGRCCQHIRGVKDNQYNTYWGQETCLFIWLFCLPWVLVELVMSGTQHVAILIHPPLTPWPSSSLVQSPEMPHKYTTVHKPQLVLTKWITQGNPFCPANLVQLIRIC
jgi:hypothetical protein